MTSPIDRDRLDTLVEAYILDALEDAEITQLNVLLDGSREARDQFRSRLHFHQLCYEVFADDADPLGLAIGRQASPLRSGGVDAVGSRWPAVVAAVLAGVLLAAGLIGGSRVWSGREDQPVAKVITSDVLPLGPLAGGRISVPTGFAEIEMLGGARFAIEAGAVVDLLTPGRVRLVQGELGADVPPEARGFTVVTDDGEIVDWGTRFGVAVLPSQPTTAMVFSGEIEVVTPKRTQMLRDRQVMAFDGTGPLSQEDAVIDERGFPMPTRVEVIPLALGDFESPDEYAVQGAETSAATAWVGDLCRIVGPCEGIAPASGRRMLQLLAASPDGEASKQNFCNVGQLIELTPYDLAGAEIEVSMQVNRLAVPKDIDTLFKLSVDDVSDEVLATAPRGKTLVTAFVLSDADMSSWETLAVRGALPSGVKRLKVHIGAQENVWNDKAGKAIEFAGHFIDEVQVRLVVPARRSLF